MQFSALKDIKLSWACENTDVVGQISNSGTVALQFDLNVPSSHSKKYFTKPFVAQQR
jgi:hypothetical protein